MTEQQKRKLRKEFEGWFATSFWVDVHYGLAALATLILIVVFAVTRTFNGEFGAFTVGMWTTALANDKVNMPSAPPAAGPTS